jgi:hypothetical protein
MSEEIMEIVDEERAEFTVTCRTEGCENADIGIVVECGISVIDSDSGARVMCGPCGARITDVALLVDNGILE